jgi:hypothetical protein
VRPEYGMWWHGTALVAWRGSGCKHAGVCVCARHGVCLWEPGRASDAVQKGAVGDVPHAKCVVEGRNELHRPKANPQRCAARCWPPPPRSAR